MPQFDVTKRNHGKVICLCQRPISLGASLKEIVMKKLVFASVSALALLSVAACSAPADNTTTRGVPDAPTPEPAPMDAAPADPATPPATDDTTTQGIAPTPETGTGGDMQTSDPVAP